MHDFDIPGNQQHCGNPLASEHGAHQGGEIQFYTHLIVPAFIQIRNSIVFHGYALDVVIDKFVFQIVKQRIIDLFLIRYARAQFGSELNIFGFFCEGNLLIGEKINGL